MICKHTGIPFEGIDSVHPDIKGPLLTCAVNGTYWEVIAKVHEARDQGLRDIAQFVDLIYRTDMEVLGNKLAKGTGMIHTIYVWAEHTSRAGYVAHIDREEFEENPYDYEEISGTKEELLEAAERYRRQNSTFSTRVAQAIEDYL